MQRKVGSLTTAINDQIRLSVNSHLDNIEDISSLIFADPLLYEYDDTDASIDDYEKIQTRSTIESSLITNSLMNNFGDFCIVYSNDQTVGKLASSTKSLLGSDSLYQTLEGFITRDTTNDGWTTGVDDYYVRLFYVKRINDNAILLAAIYTADLDALMETSNQMSNMTIRIVASDNRIIYSTDDSKVGGTPLDTTISDSTVPTSTILAEVYEIRNFTAIIAVVGVIIVIIAGLLFSDSITRPIRRIVSVMQKAEQGDLTVSANFRSFGELEVLASTFNDTMANIRTLLMEVEHVAGDVHTQVTTINDIAQQSKTISENITVAMEEVAKGAATQLDESQKTFGSLETLANNIGLTINNVAEANNSSELTREIGSNSISQIDSLRKKTDAVNESMNHMNETFDILVNEVSNIESVLSLILSISDETSLLALNASIEAARAGDAGKGFAVVAGEVSKLASQTEESTNNINEVINRIHQYVQNTVGILEDAKKVFAEQSVMVADTADSFQHIVDSTDTISKKINQIGSLTTEMSSLKEKSLNATKSILEITEHSSANTEEVLSVSMEELEISRKLSNKAGELEQAAASLQQSLSKFKISDEEVSR